MRYCLVQEGRQAFNEGRYDVKLIITSLETAKCYEKLLTVLVSREYKTGLKSKKQLLLPVAPEAMKYVWHRHSLSRSVGRTDTTSCFS